MHPTLLQVPMQSIMGLATADHSSILLHLRHLHLCAYHVIGIKVYVVCNHHYSQSPYSNTSVRWTIKLHLHSIQSVTFRTET